MKKKILFIDRDGTVIKEPPVDFQVDSLEKLEFVPGAIGALSALARRTDYRMVMVTNQDGLGTAAFPVDDFIPPHERMLSTLRGEGVEFDEVLIDDSFPQDEFSAPQTAHGHGGKIHERYAGLRKFIRDRRSYDRHAIGCEYGRERYSARRGKPEGGVPEGCCSAVRGSVPCR